MVESHGMEDYPYLYLKGCEQTWLSRILSFGDLIGPENA